MISILIPTYNYNCFALVEELNNQAKKIEIDYEIIVQDDNSQLYIEENSKINSLVNCSFKINSENLGRTINRQSLAQNSKFELLLFLDSDVFPEKKTFLKDYLDFYNNENVVCFGGYKYANIPLDASKLLRHKYGKEREEKPSKIRNKNPYSYVFSGNMLIEKSTFLNANFSDTINIYGMDIYFSYNLYINAIPVLHIDNAIYHNGLEDNVGFFNKCLESVESRKRYLADKKDISKINSLLRYYLWIKKLKFERIVYWLFLKFEKAMKTLILHKNPNITCLDLYRLGYICKK